MEDDYYTVTEVETANGYTLLQGDIYVDIYAYEDENRICDICSKDVLGVLQNDPRYAETVNEGNIRSTAQKHLEHRHLTAAAKVDGKQVSMTADGCLPPFLPTKEKRG